MVKWRPIPGFEGRYEVSDQGDVRSLLKGRVLVLKPTWVERREGNGVYYQKVGLYPGDGGKRMRLYVHRLVLTAFIREPGDGDEACHVNGDTQDNRLENLCWGSHSENLRESYLCSRTEYDDDLPF